MKQFLKTMLVFGIMILSSTVFAEAKAHPPCTKATYDTPPWFYQDVNFSTFCFEKNYDQYSIQNCSDAFVVHQIVVNTANQETTIVLAIAISKAKRNKLYNQDASIRYDHGENSLATSYINSLAIPKTKNSYSCIAVPFDYGPSAYSTILNLNYTPCNKPLTDYISRCRDVSYIYLDCIKQC